MIGLGLGLSLGVVGQGVAGATFATFLASAQKIRDAFDARYTPASDGGVTSIIAGAVGGSSTISPKTTVAVASVPNGYSHPFGIGQTWEYANRNTNAYTYSQGASKLFRFTGRYFDFNIASYDGLPAPVFGPDIAIRWRTNTPGSRWQNGATYAKDQGTYDTVGTRYFLVDMGSAADRIIEVIGGELTACSTFNFSQDGSVVVLSNGSNLTTSGERSTAPRVMHFGDSYVWGQGATDILSTMARQLGANLGLFDIYNNGIRANGFYENPVGNAPHFHERIDTGRSTELSRYGALDAVCINGTINDGGVDPLDLKPVVILALQKLRAAQPTALIVFTAHTHGPDTRNPTDVQTAYTEAFNEVLGNDPGAIMLDAVTENWIPTGAIGSSAYFPASGDTYHPNDAGHAYFGARIAQGLLLLADRIIDEDAALRAYFDLTATQTPLGQTFTRATAAWDYTSSAAVAYASGAPRISTAQGIKIAEARTNLVIEDNITVQANVTLTAGQADPLGGTAAKKMQVINTASTGHYVKSANITPAVSTIYTHSAIVKPDTCTRCQLFVAASINASAYANFLLTGEGSVTQSASCTPAIRALGDGWYMVSITFTSSAGATAGLVGLNMIGSDTTTRAANESMDTSNILYFWSMCFEQGYGATSPLPTTSATVTRDAETLTIDYPETLPYAQSTIYIEATTALFLNASGANQTLLKLANGSESLTLRRRASDGKIELVSSGLSNAVSCVSAAAVADAATFKIAIRIKANEYAISVNGATPVEDTTASAMSSVLTAAQVGYDTGSHWNGYIKEVRIYTDTKTNTSLQDMTA